MTTEKQSSLVPKLRFPGFTDDSGWDYATVAELVETITPPKKLLTSSYRLEGRFPIIDQSQSEVCGWTDDDDAVITKPLPVIVFGDHTCVLKFVQQPFAQGADGIKIMRPIRSVLTEYLFQQLSHRPLVMEQYKRHFSTLKNKHVSFPCLKSGEQRKIADFLGLLDDLISAQEQKLESLRQHKHGLMQQLFPQPGETVPRLRFPEFRIQPAWDPTFLNELAKRVNHRNTQGDELRVLSNSAEHGVIDQRDFFDKDIATNTSNYFVVELGDYVYNPRSSTLAPAGPISKNRIGKGVMSPLYIVFRFHCEANDYFAFYFKTSHWHEYLRQVSNSGARHDRLAISIDDFMQMPIPVPSPHERKKIAHCIGSLDDLIAAQEQKLESLRQHKQGLLQQLFPTPENS